MNNNTSVWYEGTVSVTINNKVTKTHNTGTLNLFKLLCKFISREQISTQDCPSYMMLYKGDPVSLLSLAEADLKNQSLIKHPLDIHSYTKEIVDNFTGTPVKTVSAHFTTTLMNAHKISGETIDETTQLSLAIVDLDNKIIAITAFSAADYIAVQAGTYAIIEWKMTFSNKE